MTFLDKYGIKFKNSNLIDVALTHSSYSNEFGGENYERLEFLGDAVLQIIMVGLIRDNQLMIRIWCLY